MKKDIKTKAGFKVPKTLVNDIKTMKPQQIIAPKSNGIIAFVVFIFTLIIYQLTNAPSLSFWDAGEYATTISNFSVLHAPGNPIYVIVGRFLNLLGLGMSEPQIASFYSSLLGALAVMFTYLMSMKLVSMFEKKANVAVLISIVASLFTAFSYTFWTNSIEAEVYSGLAFFINFIIYLLLIWVQKSEDLSHQKYFLLIIYLFFLGFGFHQTVLQIVPAVLLIAVYPMIQPYFKTNEFWVKTSSIIAGLIAFYVIVNKQNEQFSQPIFAVACAAVLMWFLRDKVSKTAWILALFAIIIGFSSHLYIPIRASFRPFINEGDPQTWDSFWRYFNREQFGGTNIADRNGNFITVQMGKHFLSYFDEQFFNIKYSSSSIVRMALLVLSALVTWIAGIYGIIVNLRKNKHAFTYLFSLFFMGSIAMVFVMNIPAETPRPRDYFFVTAYNLWTIWMGIGLVYFLKNIFNSKKLFWAVTVLALIAPTITLITQYHQHDRSKDYIAAEYGMNFLNSLEKDAIIFTNGDNDTFPLWYAQAVKDPYIINNSPSFIESDPTVYVDSLLQVKIDEAVRFKNSQCKGIRTDVTIANYSLLNTAWYVRQLRDREGINFTLADNQIEELVTPVRADETSLATNSIKTMLPTGERFNHTVFKTTPKGELLVNHLPMGYWRGQDKAAIQIIRDNLGKRPIYFASTVGGQYFGLDPYLEKHGMVFKLKYDRMSNNSAVINITKTRNNVNNVYVVNATRSDDVYKDYTTSRLISFYCSDFYQTGMADYQNENYESALNNFNKIIDIYNSIEEHVNKEYSGFNTHPFAHMKEYYALALDAKDKIDIATK